MNIVFMGTPDFAVPTLTALHNSSNHVVLVVTQPDRPKGRGRALIAPPVKEAAMTFGYPVIQPESVKTDEFEAQMRSASAEVFVVIAFGHILSEKLLSIPKFGAINVHASLLPKYRGSAPIQWGIINGEKETGVTTMLLDKGMDTGDILLIEKTPILPDDTSASLHDRLSLIGADLLLKTIDNIENIRSTPQDHGSATYAPILRKEDGHINWSIPAAKIETLIRGVTPWPGAFTFYGQKRLKIFKAAVIEQDTDLPPGTVIESFSDELRVATGKGLISIAEIQGESGKRLNIRDFLRGCPIAPGTVLA
jgi:methionyl-tRNA formyltransferase